MTPTPSGFCKNGHFKTEESTRVRKAPNGNLYHGCKICEAESSRRGKERSKARAKAGIAPQPGRKRGDAEKATIAAAWARLTNGPDTRYKQAMLEALAEFREWDARQAAAGKSKLKTNVRREVAA